MKTEEEWQEIYDERAAIMEYEGYRSRQSAETYAKNYVEMLKRREKNEDDRNKSRKQDNL